MYRHLPPILTLATLMSVVSAGAQTSPSTAVAAQQRYEREVASCNGGTLPAPAREGCIRAAGARLDSARGGPPSEALATTPDGRANVIGPDGSTPPNTTSDPVPSRDGRANVVPPADASVPR